MVAGLMEHTVVGTDTMELTSSIPLTKRRKRELHFEFETRRHGMVTIPSTIQVGKAPTIIVGRWECCPEVARQARKMVFQWAPLAIEEIEEEMGTAEIPHPNDLEYLEALPHGDLSKPDPIAKVNLEWERDQREYSARQWVALVDSREWIAKEAYLSIVRQPSTR